MSGLGILPTGRELSRVAGRGNRPNLQTAFAPMHDRVNDFIGIDPDMRSEIAGAQATTALEHLDELADELVDEYRVLLGAES